MADPTNERAWIPLSSIAFLVGLAQRGLNNPPLSWVNSCSILHSSLPLTEVHPKFRVERWHGLKQSISSFAPKAGVT